MEQNPSMEVFTLRIQTEERLMKKYGQLLMAWWFRSASHRPLKMQNHSIISDRQMTATYC